MSANIDDELLAELYAWVDKIPFSRPKKNIQRDFSDGVLVAEIVKHYCPRMVEIHNYNPASCTKKKLTNWSLLNRKVFKKLGFEITDDVMQNIVQCKPVAIEQFLMLLRRKIDRFLYENQRIVPPGARQQLSDRPEADQNITTDNMYSPTVQLIQQEPPRQDKIQSGGLELGKQIPVPPIGAGTKVLGGSKSGANQYNKTELVSKLAVEEKEQELLAKEETIQILQAKIRRMEHLLHLKDIRIDDLQSRLDRLGMELRPTAKVKK